MLYHFSLAGALIFRAVQHPSRSASLDATALGNALLGQFLGLSIMLQHAPALELHCTLSCQACHLSEAEAFFLTSPCMRLHSNHGIHELFCRHVHI